MKLAIVAVAMKIMGITGLCSFFSVPAFTAGAGSICQLLSINYQLTTVGYELSAIHLVKDVAIALLLFLGVLFAIMFRLHFRLFVKMVKNIFQVKQRASLFEVPVGDLIGNETLLRVFTTFQALLLSAIFLFMAGWTNSYFPIHNLTEILLLIGVIFLLLLLFYFFKQGMYALLGRIFVDKEMYRLWRTSYHAVFGVWGILMYIPVIWLIFIDYLPLVPLVLFLFLYILCRFVIFFKTIRIFQPKKDGFLYLILYLCGQEIMPLFLFYKGISWLYNFIEMTALWR